MQSQNGPALGGQLQNLVDRLLKSNDREAPAPVIISTTEGAYHSSVGRLVEHKNASVLALVDAALERDRPVTVFLPVNAYLGEVVSCTQQGEQFKVELVLIQQQGDGEEE